MAPQGRHGLTDGNTRIFNSMVVINVEVANCPQSDVDQRVTGQLLEHVIEERNTRLELGRAGTTVLPIRLATGGLF